MGRKKHTVHLLIDWLRSVSSRLQTHLLTKHTPTHSKQVAAAVAQAIQADQIFDFRMAPSSRPSSTNGSAGSMQEGPTLLILDRKDDPVTPLYVRVLQY